MVSSSTDPGANKPGARTKAGRFEDIALGITVAAWGVGSIAGWSRHAHDIPLPARIAMGAIHLVAASLFFRREPAVDATAWRGLLAALPTLLLSGFAFQLGATHLGTASLIALGCAATWTCASLLTLGASFSVLPSRRTLITRGPYNLLRHPAYAGELAISLICLAWSLRWESILVGIALGLATALRCVAEERVLANDAGYGGYIARVRFRLVPFLW